jgi:hypothetical protein
MNGLRARRLWRASQPRLQMFGIVLAKHSCSRLEPFGSSGPGDAPVVEARGFPARDVGGFHLLDRETSLPQ